MDSRTTSRATVRLTSYNSSGSTTSRLTSYTTSYTTSFTGGRFPGLPEDEEAPTQGADINIQKYRITEAPTGMTMEFAGSAPPEGWEECNGAAVSRSLYSNLFDIIDTTYGSGDGSTTFNLPNVSSANGFIVCIRI